jgi:RsiW-degrading membrane proteinase PrsW (M82 family)
MVDEVGSIRLVVTGDSNLQQRHFMRAQTFAALPLASSVLLGANLAHMALPPDRAMVVLSQVGWFATPVLVAMFLSMPDTARHGESLCKTVVQTLLAMLALATFAAAAPEHLGDQPAAFVLVFLAGRMLALVDQAYAPQWQHTGSGCSPRC